MAAIIGLSIGKEVIDALKLPQRTQSVDLRIAYNEVVTATVTYHVQEEDARKLLKVLAKYELHEVSSDAEPVVGKAYVQPITADIAEVAVGGADGNG
jgi:hypothetical protein